MAGEDGRNIACWNCGYDLPVTGRVYERVRR